MCGLVFIGGKHSLSGADLDVFEQMLFADTFRGDHSTGVCAIYKPYNGEGFTKMAKAAMPGPEFIAQGFMEQAVTHKLPSTVSKNASVVTFPKAVFGHNRYATAGKIVAENAHPFRHDHITLAHNGTLRNQSLLPDSRNFEVDSDNIAYSVAKIGFEETLKKLNGAYVLIWHDAKEQTLNIIRNTERPFYLAQVTSGDWFGASEELMVKWILDRQKATRKIVREIKCEPGVQYVFDVSEGCVLKEERKHTLPTFSWYDSEDYYARGYGNRAHHSRTQQPGTTCQTGKTTQTQQTVVDRDDNLTMIQILQSVRPDYKYGEVIRFQMLREEVYPLRPTHAKVVGWIPEGEDFCEVHCHSVPVGMFKKDGFVYGKIQSAFVSATIPHIIVGMEHQHNGTSLEPKFYEKGTLPDEYVLPQAKLPVVVREAEVGGLLEDQDFSFLNEIMERDNVDTSHDVLVTLTGDRFTMEQWNSTLESVCDGCGENIPFSDVPGVEIVHGFTICPECSSASSFKKDVVALTPASEVISIEDAMALEEKRHGKRPILSVTPVGKGKDKPEGIEHLKGQLCPVCNWKHTDSVIDGVMSTNIYRALKVDCPVRKYWEPKFSVKKPKWDRVCTACTIPISDMEAEMYEGMCGVCYRNFEKAVEETRQNTKEVKQLANGMKVTSDLWYKMNTCRKCRRIIPWDVADSVKFFGGAPLCHHCSD